jgi:hypothetical protein
MIGTTRSSKIYTGASMAAKKVRKTRARSRRTEKRVGGTGAKARSSDAAIDAAIKGGERAAKEVLAFRARQAGKRLRSERALAERGGGALREAAVAIPPRTRALLGPTARAGTLIAEGDSWFDYPMQDVLRILEDEYLYDIESVAHKGDNVEDMAYSGGQFEEFSRRLEKLLRRNEVPKAILLSGGGNDIAGNEFAILLNHAGSGLPAVNADIARGVIDVRLRDAYAHMIGGLTAIATKYLGRPLPIVMHGYDYPIPDGRGFLGGWWALPGPWLQPGFRRKGHGDLATNQKLIASLIDQFNDVLSALVAHPDFAHVHYVDLRGTLVGDSGYKKHWANELHPTSAGFHLVTERFASVIDAL